MVIPIYRPTLRELCKAIRENERRGYECVAPFTKITKHRKKWEYSKRNDDFKDFKGVDTYECYFVKMKPLEKLGV